MILIYLAAVTPRHIYVFDWIFVQRWNMSYKLTQNKDEFEQFPGIKINYSDVRTQSGFFIFSHGLLEDDSLKRIEIPMIRKENQIHLFPSENCDLGYDIFCAVFYMLSRYEEYLPFEEDSFGRFPASASVAVKHDFLEKPVLDESLHHLALKLKVPLHTAGFTPVITYDIDVAFKYAGRPLWRTLGSIGKDFTKGKLRQTVTRLFVLANIRKDPWDVYDSIQTTLQQLNLPAIFFFLAGDRGTYDRNLNVQTSRMRALIRKVALFASVGIHPSFASASRLKKIEAEKDRVKTILQTGITKSRQHFLKLSFPETYLNLRKAGITQDYSMGYPERAGFRAGTCHPFYFYDLKNEETTDLKIIPVTCMDATFIHYDRKQPAEALAKMKELLLTVKKNGGMFVPIWHNEYLEENASSESWKRIHDQLLEEIAKIQQA